ncbi:MAG: hypothetical protein ABIS20_00500 [Thermoanaerobaculia bacterium]
MAFYILLVRVADLDKLGWKKIDYIWLGLTALSLLTASSEVRRLVAGNRITSETIYRDATYERLQYRADFLRGGAVCREFVRSELSPPDFDEVQAQFREVCNYGKMLYASLPPKPPKAPRELKLPLRPRVSDQQLLGFYVTFDSSWNEYIQAEHWLKELMDAAEKTDAEVTFVFFSPILLALALALRITKVTGEIRLERDLTKNLIKTGRQGIKVTEEKLDAPNPRPQADG